MNRLLPAALVGAALLAVIAVIVSLAVRAERPVDVTQQPASSQPTTAPEQPTQVPSQATATAAQPTPAPQHTSRPATMAPAAPTSTAPPVAKATPVATVRPTAPPTAVPTATPPRLRVARGLSERTSRVYPKQTYYLYVPKQYDGTARYRLLVVMHGDGRNVEEYTKQFTDFADDNRYIILAPYFPEDERFQQLGIGEKEKTIRFDKRLLGLVDEVGKQLYVERETFDLFGFSAGGQFAHRFLYLHPERLRSVVVASPGTVTVPKDRYEWPAGFGELDDLAKVSVNLALVRQVRVMLTVGRDDVEDGNLNDSDAADRFGDTRLERARTLHAAWDDAQIGHRFIEIKGLDHTLDERTVKPATKFLAEG